MPRHSKYLLMLNKIEVDYAESLQLLRSSGSNKVYLQYKIKPFPQEIAKNIIKRNKCNCTIWGGGEEAINHIVSDCPVLAKKKRIHRLDTGIYDNTTE